MNDSILNNIDPAIFEKVQRTTWSWCKKNTIPSGYDR